MADQTLPTTPHADTIAGLRALADFFEQHPHLPALQAQTLNIWTDKTGLVTAARTGGKWAKNYSGSFFYLQRSFGPFSLEINAIRDVVCTKVVTGTRIIPAQPSRIIEATPARVEDITEWRCDGLLSVPAETEETDTPSV